MREISVSLYVNGDLIVAVAHSLLTLAKKPWLITDLSCLSEPLVVALLELVMRGLKLDRRLLHLFRATGHERVLAYVCAAAMLLEPWFLRVPWPPSLTKRLQLCRVLSDMNEYAAMMGSYLTESAYLGL